MSWMDFKMAQAMKSQKINEDSKRVQVGKSQKGTGYVLSLHPPVIVLYLFVFLSFFTSDKHQAVAEDLMTKHAKDAQKVNSYSKSAQLTQQKGTGEKPNQISDDVLT